MDINPLSSSAQNINQPSASSGAFSQLTDNFDTFLTLLTTQLRNQDPLEPLDTEQFTQQLVQFAGVEQSIQTNQNLETLISLQSATDRQASIDLIGRDVTVNSNEALLSNSSERGNTLWQYNLPVDIAALSINVLDENGTRVAILEGPSTPGTHQISWDGRNTNGQPVPAGVYRLEILATTGSGLPINSVIQTRGQVDGVTLNGNNPQISVGGRLVSLDTVTRVNARF